jgi:hypothetical protein
MSPRGELALEMSMSGASAASPSPNSADMFVFVFAFALLAASRCGTIWRVAAAFPLQRACPPLRLRRPLQAGERCLDRRGNKAILRQSFCIPRETSSNSLALFSGGRGAQHRQGQAAGRSPIEVAGES